MLTEAEGQLRSAGLEKAAQQVAVVHKVVQEDKNPEHYINNLLQHGMMQDLDCSNDAGPDTSSCSEGEQPQLSQDELKRLRGILNPSSESEEAPKEESKEPKEPKEESKESKESDAKSDEGDDENDVQAVVKNQTGGGEMELNMTTEETKQVLSHRKSLLKELSALL